MVYDKKSFETTYKKRAGSLLRLQQQALDLSEQSRIVVRGANGKLLKLGGQFGEVGVVLAVNGSVDVVRDWPTTLVHVTWPGVNNFSNSPIITRLTAANRSVRVVAAKFRKLDSGKISRVVATAAVSLVEVTGFGLEISGEPDIRRNYKKNSFTGAKLPADIGTAWPTVGAESDVLRLVIILN